MPPSRSPALPAGPPGSPRDAGPRGRPARHGREARPQAAAAGRRRVDLRRTRGDAARFTNAGHPIVLVEDGNFENRGELLLVHRHEGLDLDPSWTTETLANIARLWSRPANVLTEREGKKVRVRHDGTEARTVDA